MGGQILTVNTSQKPQITFLNASFWRMQSEKPYESEIRREKAKIKQREYYQKAEQDSATPEEKKAILSNWKNH